MIMHLLGCACTIVAHILLGAPTAHFKVCVSVDFGHSIWVDSALAMESVDVLADNSLQDTSIHQLNHSHMCLGGLCLTDGLLEGSCVSCGQGLAGPFHILLILLLKGCLLPAARSSLENRTIPGTIVWNTSGC